MRRKVLVQILSFTVAVIGVFSLVTTLQVLAGYPIWLSKTYDDGTRKEWKSAGDKAIIGGKDANLSVQWLEEENAFYIIGTANADSIANNNGSIPDMKLRLSGASNQLWIELRREE